VALMAVPVPPKPPVTSPPYSPGGGGGGGTPATGGGTVNIPNSNGGVFAQSQIALFPCYNVYNSRVEYRALDPTQGFNDPLAARHYSWRVEQFKPYRQATIRRLIVTFKDIGQATMTWTITGVNDIQEVISKSVSLGFGNRTPTNRLMTVPVDFMLTGMNLQISVDQNPNDGPLCIVQMFPVGTIEENEL